MKTRLCFCSERYSRSLKTDFIESIHKFREVQVSIQNIQRTLNFFNEFKFIYEIMAENKVNEFIKHCGKLDIPSDVIPDREYLKK